MMKARCKRIASNTSRWRQQGRYGDGGSDGTRRCEAVKRGVIQGGGRSKGEYKGWRKAKGRIQGHGDMAVKTRGNTKRWRKQPHLVSPSSKSIRYLCGRTSDTWLFRPFPRPGGLCGGVHYCAHSVRAQQHTRTQRRYPFPDCTIRGRTDRARRVFSAQKP